MYRASSMKDCRVKVQLKKAIRKREFEVFLQPKIDLETERLRGAEALIRWIKGNKSEMRPDKFIPILEQMGMIKQVDLFVLEQVCLYLQKWQLEKKIMFPIAVNISKTYMQETAFVDSIVKILDTYQIETKWIELEITESTSLEQSEAFVNLIEKLRLKGFSIAMDDFGTGYSSLNLLKDLPINVLKLDKGFIQSSCMTEKSKIIIECIIHMAHLVGIEVVAEGIEKEEQIVILKQLQCDMGQGYYYAEPMSVEAYEEYMSRAAIQTEK